MGKLEGFEDGFKLERLGAMVGAFRIGFWSDIYMQVSMSDNYKLVLVIILLR